jgi:hypothetical protein
MVNFKSGIGKSPATANFHIFALQLFATLQRNAALYSAPRECTMITRSAHG